MVVDSFPKRRQQDYVETYKTEYPHLQNIASVSQRVLISEVFRNTIKASFPYF